MRSAPTSRSSKSPGLVKLCAALKRKTHWMASGGDHQDHAGPGGSRVPHRFVPIVPRVLSCQALGFLPGREDQRTPLCCSTTRCDGGCENPGRRSGCMSEGMPRPSGHHLRMEAAGSWGPHLVRCLFFFPPLTLLALQGRPAGNQSGAGGILKTQGDIRDQNEARPGSIARDAGTTGSWAQALL